MSQLGTIRRIAATPALTDTGGMRRSRPSPRLVALLAYALVVNALVWASGAIAGPTPPIGALPASVICHTSTDEAGAPALPATAGHTCCDLACGAAVAIAPPVAGWRTPPRASRLEQGQRFLSSSFSQARTRPWATGPPSA